MGRGPNAVFDHQKLEIGDNILRLGEMVDIAIDRSMAALRDQDHGLARAVNPNDTAINDLRFTVAEESLSVIATEQPIASDLRLIIALMNLVTDLERMANHATGICKTVLRMGGEPLLKSLIDLPRMASTARDMLRHSLDTYVTRDVVAARVVAAQDDEIDHLYHAIFDELLVSMARDHGTIPRGTYLLWSARNLERIGAGATNIDERVIFMTTGTMTELNI